MSFRVLMWMLAMSAGSAAAPLATQEPSSKNTTETVYAEIGDWTIRQAGDACSLYTEGDAFYTQLFIAQRAQVWRRLDVNFDNYIADEAKAAERIELVIGSYRVPAVWRSESNTFRLDDMDDVFVEQFEKGSWLTLELDGSVQARFSLRGSARAFENFSECLNAPTDTSRRMPLPPYGPWEPPLEPDQKPQPINPSAWIRADDYPAHHPGEGTVTVRLIVHPSGRVHECAIVESTAPHRLEEASCKALTFRARFRPATDSAGKPIQGEYLQAVRWSMPLTNPIT